VLDAQFAPSRTKIVAAKRKDHASPVQVAGQYALALSITRAQRKPGQGGARSSRTTRASSGCRPSVHRMPEHAEPRPTPKFALPLSRSHDVTFHLNGDDIYVFHGPARYRRDASSISARACPSTGATRSSTSSSGHRSSSVRHRRRMSLPSIAWLAPGRRQHENPPRHGLWHRPNCGLSVMLSTIG